MFEVVPTLRAIYRYRHEINAALYSLHVLSEIENKTKIPSTIAKVLLTRITKRRAKISQTKKMELDELVV